MAATEEDEDQAGAALTSSGHSMLDIPYAMQFLMARFLAARGLNEC
jgi:hypothetical protein